MSDIEALHSEIKILKQTIEGMEQTSKMLVRRDIDLRNAYDDLKSLDREKTEFVSIAAHQLRTPVTTARWAMTELQQKLASIVDIQTAAILKQASASVERIFHLTEDLLELNRIDFGETILHKTNIHIEKLLESVCEDHTAMITFKSIRLEKKYAHEPKPVQCDAERMRDIIDNLLDNAIKYTPHDGSITIETRYKTNSVCIEVSDSGIGVEPGLEEKIFQKFTRLGNAESIDPNGIGLGLYIARNLVSKHNGSLEFRHNNPSGSIFSINLPC